MLWFQIISLCINMHIAVIIRGMAFGLASTTFLTVQQDEDLVISNKAGWCNSLCKDFRAWRQGMARVINVLHYAWLKKTGSRSPYQSACSDTVKSETGSLQLIFEISYWTCWLCKFMWCSWWLLYEILLMIWNSRQRCHECNYELTSKRCSSLF